VKDPQSFVIALLLVTAAILGAMVFTAYRGTSQTAYAEASVKQGDYVMVTGAWSTNNDLLYVLDLAARKLNVYYLNDQRSTIDPVTDADLNAVFAAE